MGTKIINVLRDDKLEDILHIFRTTLAEEVIFVLPKKTRAFSEEASFSVLADESRELSKGVLILSENPEVNEIAANYDLGVLTSEGGQKNKRKAELVKSIEDEEVAVAEPTAYTDSDNDESDTEMQDDIDDVENDDDSEENKNEIGFPPLEYQEEAVSNDSSVETILTATPKAPKSMNDILGPNPDDSISVKVKKKIEKPVNIGVKKENIKSTPPVSDFKEKTALDEIQNVWQRREAPNKIYSGPAPGFKLPGFPVGKWASGLSRKYLYLYGLGVVVIFGIVVFVSTGKADVFIKPRVHALKFDLNITVSDQFVDIDSELRRIPGQLFSVDKKIEEVFTSSGEKDVVQKARGVITVYNEYGTTPQVLIATTRFESSDGLIFKTLKTITVPGTKVQNGTIIPGSITVEVIADKAGEIYNIEPGKFTIPAFKENGDNDRFEKFYGRSESAMKGGIVGKAKVVTEGDYINAKKEIEEKIIAETVNELNNQAAGLKILDIFNPTINDILPSAEIDEATDNFSVIGTAELNTIGFREEDLHRLIATYVESINSDIITFPDKLEVKYKDIKLNDDDKILEFTISVEGSAYSRINEEKIVMDLMDQGEDYITGYFKEIEGISSARVVLSPFWVWKVPSDINKIHVEIEYE
jgi:hypothetical protein